MQSLSAAAQHRVLIRARDPVRLVHPPIAQDLKRCPRPCLRWPPRVVIAGTAVTGTGSTAEHADAAAAAAAAADDEDDDAATVTALPCAPPCALPEEEAAKAMEAARVVWASADAVGADASANGAPAAVGAASLRHRAVGGLGGIRTHIGSALLANARVGRRGAVLRR